VEEQIIMEDQIMRRDASGNTQVGEIHFKLPTGLSAMSVIGGDFRFPGGIQHGDEVVFDNFYKLVSRHGATLPCQERIRDSKIFVHSETMHTLSKLSEHINRLLRHSRRIKAQTESVFSQLLDSKYSCAEINGRYITYKATRSNCLEFGIRKTSPHVCKNSDLVRKYEHLINRGALVRSIIHDLDYRATQMVMDRLPSDRDEGFIVVTSYGIRRGFLCNYSGHWFVNFTEAEVPVDLVCIE